MTQGRPLTYFDEGLSCYQSARLSSIPGIVHGFFSRKGGVSGIEKDELNFRAQNNSLKQRNDNKNKILKAFGGSALFFPHQQHTCHVLGVDALWDAKKAPEADALVTEIPGVILGVLTADCVPVLLAARNKPIIAAVHAGWKGAFGGILDKTLAFMRKKGAKDIVAAIGPCIRQGHYEVGPEFLEYYGKSFLGPFYAWETFFKPSSRPQAFLFDLPGFVHATLQKQGILEIEDLKINTYTNPEYFYSYRRSTHEKSIPISMGNQASCIMVRERDIIRRSF